jgi:type IV secretion system protein VirB5
MNCNPEETAMTPWLRKRIAYVLIAVAGAIAPLPRDTHAGGMPVIDTAAITQLMQQVRYWQQQVQYMADQLNTARAAYNAITGGRGMEALVPITAAARNYLPPDYAELMSVVNNASATYAGIASQVQSIMAANAVLTGGQIGVLSPQQQRIVTQGRQAAATLQMIAQQAQQNTSQRFGALQQLITAIGTAGDQKAIQDLQGRIAAEQTMLTVEQTKLQALYQMAQAQELQRQQMVRESAVRAVGSLSTANHPAFP